MVSSAVVVFYIIYNAQYTTCSGCTSIFFYLSCVYKLQPSLLSLRMAEGPMVAIKAKMADPNYSKRKKDPEAEDIEIRLESRKFTSNSSLN